MNKQALFAHLKQILEQSFEVAPELITPEALLYDDLDIDSIDAVDLVAKLKPLVGQRLQPDAFKAVRTVQDVVDAMAELLNAAPDSN